MEVSYQLLKVNEVSFETTDTITAATLSNQNEIVFLLDSGCVKRFNFDTKNH